MAALAYLAPDFLKEGRLYWLRTPLYIVKTKTKNYYFYNDDEYNQNGKKLKGEVSRAKGIGALGAEEAKESMFTEEFQRLEQLSFSDEDYPLLESLMGKDIEPRKEFVYNKIDFSEVKE